MSENTAVCTELVVALNFIVFAVFIVDSLLLGSSRYLIVVTIELIFSKDGSATVADTDTTGIISVNGVDFDFGEGAASQHNASSLVLHDFVFRNVSGRIKYHNAVTVVINFVLDDPSKARFDSKDAFTTTFTDLIAEDSSVTGHVSSKGNVGFIIHFDRVLLDMGVSRFNQQDALTIVLHDFIVLNHDCCKVRSFNARKFILSNCQVFLYSGVVVLACAEDAVTFILSDGVEPDNCITPEVILGFGDNAVLVVVGELIHSNEGLRGNSLNS